MILLLTNSCSPLRDLCYFEYFVKTSLQCVMPVMQIVSFKNRRGRKEFAICQKNALWNSN